MLLQLFRWFTMHVSKIAFGQSHDLLFFYYVLHTGDFSYAFYAYTASSDMLIIVSFCFRPQNDL